MKKLRYSLFIIASAWVIASCTKVINVDLKDADKKYVIEGNITNLPGPYIVKVTQTKSFEGNNTFPPVSGAVVTISDNAGHSEILQQAADGTYKTSTIQGVQGVTYNLKVVVGGQTFTSTSTMPYRVPLDSVYVTRLAYFGDDVNALVPAFTDPVGIKNYYFFNVYRNGIMDQSLYVQDDEFSDGKYNTRPLFPPDKDSAVVKGDTAYIEMQCTDASVNKYWTSLEQVTSGNSATPTNPVTNITGGALGYFSAHTTQRKGLRVK
ncbi:MAG: DUF4249 domain-containing protein [Filimonas sp.]|nr:DUF4249 domain-containing protein [Filimonas sp.]